MIEEDFYFCLNSWCSSAISDLVWNINTKFFSITKWLNPPACSSDVIIICLFAFLCDCGVRAFHRVELTLNTPYTVLSSSSDLLGMLEVESCDFRSLISSFSWSISAFFADAISVACSYDAAWCVYRFWVFLLAVFIFLPFHNSSYHPWAA